MDMIRDEGKPATLSVKRDGGHGVHFHYDRAERLKLKGDPDGPEARKRALVRKTGKVLIIILAIAVAALVFLFLFKIFFA